MKTKFKILPETHQKRHKIIHKYLLELVDDLSRHEGNKAMKITVEELVNWNEKQTNSPTDVLNNLAHNDVWKKD